MTQMSDKRLFLFRVSGVVAAALFLMGADDTPKQTIDAKGITFDAPKSWESSTPSGQMRRAQLKVEPIEGDDYAAELIVFAIPGGGGTVEANLTRWQKLFKDEDGNPPKIESKKIQAKNVEVTRAETSGHYYPASFPGTPKQPDRPGARLLGVIITGEKQKHGYFIRMVGPDKTMKKLTKDFDEMIKTIKLDEE
jgi:hypothetical protein